MEIAKENQEWVRRFTAIHGRAPRVLHISNIANNAYNNAKLLNQAGLENHVIAHNDYYAMGCPEWEDADFMEAVEDLWKPEWCQMDLKDFRRPSWFAQGDLACCVDYLIALCEQDEVNACRLLNLLSQQNGTTFAENQRLDGVAESNQDKISHIIRLGKTWLKQILLSSYRGLRVNVLKWITALDAAFHTSLRYRAHQIFNGLKIRKILQDRIASNKPDPTDELKWEIDQALIAEFKAEFPERGDPLSENDFVAYQVPRIHFRRLLDYYDIIVGYAIEGIYPLMCGKPYFCYEHGTIRDIPYATDGQGRICSITYRKARHVFVTNFDCIKSAEFLAPARFTAINHAYDEDQPLHIAHDWEAYREHYLGGLKADMLLFHPTRHDWIEGKGYADKANEVFLQAFAASREAGLRVGLICCEWGHNVSESKALISQLGMDPYVHWVKPLGIVAYTRMCKAAHLVVDQFKIGSFGGITFKALAASAPIMTYLKHELLLQQYAEIPPVINCKTQADIMEALFYYYEKKKELEGIGQKGRNWMKRYHNKSDTVNLQLRQFGDLLLAEVSK